MNAYHYKLVVRLRREPTCVTASAIAVIMAPSIFEIKAGAQ